MPITIAIDGRSSCGKSTLARDLAGRLGYIYVDSGAMYRAVTLHFLREGVTLENESSVARALRGLELSFRNEGVRQRVLLNGEVVEEELRSMAVNQSVSPVAAIGTVRRELVRQQQAIGARGGIVMDGRDIGTVVFPQAELKLFVTASEDERVRRRYDELLAGGRSATTEAVRANLLERDRIDSTRADSPLRQADDAVVLDNTNLTRGEQAAMATALAHEREA